MSKNVAAINIVTREQFGESQYLSKYASQLAELLEPVALQANKELYSEEYQALSNQAQALVSAGVMSAAEAQRYVNQAFGIYMDPYGKISRGSTIDKWSTINALQNGQINSPSGILSQLVGTTSTALGWAGGNSMNASIIQNVFGTNSFRNMNLVNMSRAMEMLSDLGTLSPEELEAKYGNEISKADNYNTNTQKLDTALLNATADISEIKTLITDNGWKLGETIVKGITAWLGASVIAKAAGILGGSNAGGPRFGGFRYICCSRWRYCSGCRCFEFN